MLIHRVWFVKIYHMYHRYICLQSFGNNPVLFDKKNILIIIISLFISFFLLFHDYRFSDFSVFQKIQSKIDRSRKGCQKN